MSNELTKQQAAAVKNRGGKLLISAAAGSGKTKVLVDRLLSYLMDPDDPANLDDFLIITYTKAAAAELRGKISAKLSEYISLYPQNRYLQRQMQRLYLAKISTVHAFCGDLLREYAHKLDVPADFRVLDEPEAMELQIAVMERILDEAYNHAGESPDFCAFIDTQGLGRDDRLVPQIVLQVYHSAQCHLNPEAWLDWCVSSSETGGLTDAGETVWGRYLIDDLHTYLDMQIDALNRCLLQTQTAEGMDKVAVLLQSTLIQLQSLRGQDTWDDVIAHSQIDYGRISFPRNCPDLVLKERIQSVRNACKEGVAKKLRAFTDDSACVLRDLSSCSAAARGLVDLVRQFGKEYDKRKHSRRVLDFADLEHRTLDLLLGKNRSAPTVLAAEIGNRFREIMVDEYQDSNQIQDAIFSALTQKRQNCFMVGDVKQSIYQFRLADPGIFIEKYNAYKDADDAQPGQGRKIVLSKNFRSSAGVISAVNDVFSACMSPMVGGLEYGESEMLHEGIPHVALEEPETVLYGIDVKEDTYAEEAAFTAEQICKLLDGTHMIRQDQTLRPIRPEDIVILLRSPGSVGAEFAYALEKRGIRCITGGSVDLLQTQEIETLRSLLQVISNPLQDIPLIAVLSSPVFGFTSDELAAIRSIRRGIPMYDAICRAESEHTRQFLELLDGLRLDARLLPLPQLMDKIFKVTHMDSVYSAMEGGEERLRNLQMFTQIVSQYDSGGRKDVEQFLDYLDMAEDRGLVSSAEQQDAGAVTLMSIHKSKGLEFPVVFLCGLSRSFNRESIRAQVLCDKDLGLGLTCVNAAQRVRYPTIARRAIATRIVSQMISEELRVLYVAMTRARDRLFMTYAAKNLATDLFDLANRMDMSSPQLLTSEADCPGTWILYTALSRTESGPFFALGGHPDCAVVKEPFWSVHVVQADEQETILEGVEDAPNADLNPAIVEKIGRYLDFVYPHELATTTPSKQTATQLKGRQKDQEAAENTGDQLRFNRSFRKPGFARETVSGVEYGNAVHAVMQYLDFNNCTDIDSITAQIMQFKDNYLITQEQAELIDPAQILTFVTSPLGSKVCRCEQVIREFKFSILDDGGKYTPDLQGEHVLLQGVVDCAMIESDGITIIDFKTDKVTEDSVTVVAEKYHPQVVAYADALQRIYGLPVKSAVLYFFRIGKAVPVEIL